MGLVWSVGTVCGSMGWHLSPLRALPSIAVGEHERTRAFLGEILYLLTFSGASAASSGASVGASQVVQKEKMD